MYWIHADMLVQSSSRKFIIVFEIYFLILNNHEKNSWMQIARELRLRDIGGIIVVDFIDMTDDCKYDFGYYSDKW